MCAYVHITCGIGVCMYVGMMHPWTISSNGFHQTELEVIYMNVCQESIVIVHNCRVDDIHK